jgi:hypothetical protein
MMGAISEVCNIHCSFIQMIAMTLGPYYALQWQLSLQNLRSRTDRARHNWFYLRYQKTLLRSDFGAEYQ